MLLTAEELVETEIVALERTTNLVNLQRNARAGNILNITSFSSQRDTMCVLSDDIFVGKILRKCSDQLHIRRIIDDNSKGRMFSFPRADDRSTSSSIFSKREEIGNIGH